MEPEHLRFGGGATETLLHPLVAVEMLIAIILILCLPRKYAIAPLLFAVFTISLGQVVVFGGDSLYGTSHPHPGWLDSTGGVRAEIAICRWL